MGCVDKCTSACPFACTEQSEIVQNYGCLPTMQEIVFMRQKFSKTWACHEDVTKPCVGAIRHMKEKGLPYKVVDKELVHERTENLAELCGVTS